MYEGALTPGLHVTIKLKVRPEDLFESVNLIVVMAVTFVV